MNYNYLLLLQECAKLNVKCVVAPYEADAQLAYLMIQGVTQLTISEDSDLLLYGCSKVFYNYVYILYCVMCFSCFRSNTLF